MYLSLFQPFYLSIQLSFYFIPSTSTPPLNFPFSFKCIRTFVGASQMPSMRHWGLSISFTVEGFTRIWCCYCSPPLDSVLQQTTTTTTSRLCNKCQLWQVRLDRAMCLPCRAVPCLAWLAWNHFAAWRVLAAASAHAIFRVRDLCLHFNCCAFFCPPLALSLSSSASCSASFWRKLLHIFTLLTWEFSFLYFVFCRLVNGTCRMKVDNSLAHFFFSFCCFWLLLLLCTFRLLESLE